MTAERLQAAFAKACLARDASFDADLLAFLAAHGVAEEDAEALVAAPRRLGLYRRLVRANLVGVIEAMLPRTREQMEKAAPGTFDASVARFLEEQGPRTAHLRDVPSELLAHALPHWRADERLPPWIGDFAELELVDFVVGVAPRSLPPPELAEVSADRPLAFAEPKTFVRFAWSVHEEHIEERDCALLVYRDAEHRTRYLEVTPLAALILERLFAGETLGAAMTGASEASGHPLDDSVLAGAAALLADLAERGVLLGAS